MNWFSAVELIQVEGHSRTATELVRVESIENRFDEDMAAQWRALTAPRPPLQLGERTVRLDQPQVMAIINATPDSFSDGGQFADAAAAAEAGADMAARARRSSMSAENRPAPALGRSGKATRSRGSSRSSGSSRPAARPFPWTLARLTS